MLKVYKSIQESFNFSYSVSKVNMPHVGNADVSEFFTEDGRKYLIINDKNPYPLQKTFNGFYSSILDRDFICYKLDFFMLKDPNKMPSPDNIVQIKASTPHAVKVFSTVINYSKQFYANKTGIDMLIVSSFQGESGRLPLYTKLIKKLATEQGGILIGKIEDFIMFGSQFDLSITLHQDTIHELGINLEKFKQEFNIV
jgi:hypothetical protein